MAREIQHGILPHLTDLKKVEGIDTVDIYASMLAAKDVGGDFYDFFRVDDHRFGFAIADVSGKGVPAAIFMAVSHTLIKSTGIRGMSSDECMKTVNDILCDESVGSMFVTVFYGIYDIQTGQVEFTNAGHNPPYILRADGRVEMLECSRNLVLGVMDGITFQSETLQLNPGDALVMYTDGVTEAENPVHDQFAESRLETTLAQLKGASSKDIVETVNAKVAEFADGAPQSDDITQLVIRRK